MPKRVLLVEDDEFVARAHTRALQRYGWEVVSAGDVDMASAKLLSEPCAVVLCNISLPSGSGVDILRVVRRHDMDVPVLLITGRPTVETAIQAVELGAIEYLTKPIDVDVLNERVERAFQLGKVARARRAALHAADAAPASVDLADLGHRFDRAVGRIHMEFQPIFDLKTRAVRAYEALLRSDEHGLSTPLAVLAAAERLNRNPELGRQVRGLVAAAVADLPAGAEVFVNMHASDFLDPSLYVAEAPLSALAGRVVLEVTERGSLDAIPDLKLRATALRDLGYRLAIDDFGAGYSGLASFALLEPEIVKLDMSLVRNVHGDSMKRRLIESVNRLCMDLDIEVVAEGIESAEELDVIRELGCHLGQGFVLGHPLPTFLPPAPRPD
jgi:EAL domain-containing protein (putative c-di-GMP-specific phosphodiesterase class I)